jgi:glucose-1-phosphate cytidylyltransferase
MVEIGGRPILWHLMKNLSTFGIQQFTICTGYKSEKIKEFFLSHETMASSIRIKYGDVTKVEPLDADFTVNPNWQVDILHTGETTNTGGRIFRARDNLNGSRFLCTYGDGLADVNIKKLIEFHLSHGKIATVTVVKPVSRFGMVAVDQSGAVTQFVEKPIMDNWVNAGFFIFESEIFDYLNDESVLEETALKALTAKGELVAFKHEGFWQPMDTYRETQILENLWAKNDAPWKNWD